MTKSVFEVIPGVGPKIAGMLHELEFNTISDLRGENPEDLYNELMGRYGTHLGRCLLYVLRLAVYYAENDAHDPDCLKWWNWKDGGAAQKNTHDLSI